MLESSIQYLWCLALKDNHKTLRKAASEAFANEEVERCTFTAPVETAHGRIEQRSVVAIPASAVKPRVLGEWAKDARTFFYAVTESNIKSMTIKEHQSADYS